MFGYVKPAHHMLRVYELDMYKSLYCGLCHSLKRKYGTAARFVLSYDFAFLCAILWEPEEKPVYEKRRCPIRFKKKTCLCNDNFAMDRAAGYGVIFAYHKLRDNIADEGFIKSLISRMGSLGLKWAYKKAVREFPQFDADVAKHLSNLADFEDAGDKPSDVLAGEFATLLSLAAQEESAEDRRRILSNLLFHTGRFIYLIDARDDLEEDEKKNRFNPLGDKKVDDENLELTLNHSANLAAAAFELLPETDWSEISRNILYFGLSNTVKRVLSGEKSPAGGYRNI